MKKLLFLFIFIPILSFAQGEFTGPTTARNSAQVQESEMKINKLLDDAKTGKAPLTFTGSFIQTGTGNVTAYQGGTWTITLPTGAATSANQTSILSAIVSGSSSRNVITSATPSTVTLTSTSGTVLASNASRLDAYITNTGTNWAYLSRSGTAIAGQGMALAPSGGTLNITPADLYRGIITGITSAATTTLSISEGQ